MGAGIFLNNNLWNHHDESKGIAKGGVTKKGIKGGVSVCLRLSTFAHVCLRLLAFSPLRLLAFVRVCLRLFAFARICLRPPLLRPPLRDTERRICHFTSKTRQTPGSPYATMPE